MPEKLQHANSIKSQGKTPRGKSNCCNSIKARILNINKAKRKTQATTVVGANCPLDRDHMVIIFIFFPLPKATTLKRIVIISALCLGNKKNIGRHTDG